MPSDIDDLLHVPTGKDVKPRYHSTLQKTKNNKAK